MHPGSNLNSLRPRVRLALGLSLGLLAAIPVQAAFMPGGIDPISNGNDSPDKSGSIFGGDWTESLGGIFGSDNPLEQIQQGVFGSVFDGTLVDQGMEALGKVLGGGILDQSEQIWNESLGELGIPDPLKTRTQVESIFKGADLGGSNNGCYSGLPSGGNAFMPGPIVEDCQPGTTPLPGGGTNNPLPGGGSGGIGQPKPGDILGSPGGINGNSPESDPPDIFEVSRTVYSVFAGNEVNRQSTLSHLNNVIGTPGQAQAKQELEQTQQMVQQNAQTAGAAQKQDVTQDVMKLMTTIQARDSVIAAATRADTVRLRQDVQYSNLNLVNASRTLDEITRAHRVESSADAMYLMELSGQSGLN